MKVTVKITVVDGPRQAALEFEVDGGSPYGQNPVIGATEKVLALSPKLVEVALGTVAS